MMLKRATILILIASACQLTAEAQRIRCPGHTTLEMRECAEMMLGKSELRLKNFASSELLRQWQATRSSMCDQAYGHRDGTIWPQLETECNINLNQAIIKEFEFKLGD